MTTIHPKNQILESLPGLDQVQAEKVLDYINQLLQGPPQRHRKTKSKVEAMKQIRQALGQSSQPNLTF